MLHINYFPKFFVLILLQVAIKQSYFDPKLQSELEGRIDRKVSKDQEKSRAEMTVFSDAFKEEIGEARKSTKRK